MLVRVRELKSDAVCGFIILSAATVLAAMNECETRGIRGGAVYDYLHLVCARSAGATEFFTLDVSNFKAFWRDGDPQILHPSKGVIDP